MENNNYNNLPLYENTISAGFPSPGENDIRLLSKFIMATPNCGSPRLG
jgi:hypothetical protein